MFATNVQAVPGKPGVATFAYDVPSAVQQTARGRVYRLSIQHQPLANPQQLHVRITLPPGATVSSAPGWTVKDGVASFDGTLLKDTTLEIVF